MTSSPLPSPPVEEREMTPAHGAGAWWHRESVTMGLFPLNRQPSEKSDDLLSPTLSSGGGEGDASG